MKNIRSQRSGFRFVLVVMVLLSRAVARIAFWPLIVYRCLRMNERTFEGRAAESLEYETLRYALFNDPMTQ